MRGIGNESALRGALADPAATTVRELMAQRSSRAGRAADLLRASADFSRSRIGTDRAERLH
jgi:hypothetical protein